LGTDPQDAFQRERMVKKWTRRAEYMLRAIWELWQTEPNKKGEEEAMEGRY